MKTKLNILFWPRIKRGEEKSNPAHMAYIICRLTVRGQGKHMLEFSTGLETQRSNWQSNGAHSHVKGRTGADRHVNTQLVKLIDELNDIHADLERRGKSVTARAIYRLYKNNGATLSLVELYEAFLAERKTLIGLEISESSYKVTVWRLVVLKAFLAHTKQLDLRPEEFTHNIGDKFVQWGLTEKKYNRNNINKALQNIVQALRWGVRRGHLDKNPMELFRYKAAAKVEIKFLNVGELQQLTAHEMPNAHLDRARDCFVFQCWTGLAYADLAALDVARDARYDRNKGTNMIRRTLYVTRAKSAIGQGYECVIPLMAEAERLLAKYEDKMPVPSNQAYNRFLKEVGQLSGLPLDKMTSHVGRKTAGVMMLNAGMRMETVSKFLGHASVKMTEKLYAKILDTTVVDEFWQFFGALPAMPPAPVTVYELPRPRPEPVVTRPARRLEIAEAVTVEVPDPGFSWRRPPPVTSRSAQKGGALL